MERVAELADQIRQEADKLTSKTNVLDGDVEYGERIEKAIEDKDRELAKIKSSLIYCHTVSGEVERKIHSGFEMAEEVGKLKQELEFVKRFNKVEYAAKHEKFKTFVGYTTPVLNLPPNVDSDA